MRLLVSAFAFAPNIGSEPGVGWRWVVELAKHHQVTVVTDFAYRRLLEADGVVIPANIEMVYYRPALLRRVKLSSTNAQLLYLLWQFGLLAVARRLHAVRRFDAAMHMTYGVFRQPSFLGYLGIPFVFGPVGGGEDAPLALKKSIRGREKLKELLRSLVNKIALVDPFLWAAYAKAALILTKTEDTRQALPWPFRRRAVVFAEIGIDAPAGIEPVRRAPDEPLRVLFAGRFVGWKGAHLAIRAVAEAIGRGVPIEFSLLGKGPFEGELRAIAQSLGMDRHVRWLGHIPQSELFALYRTMHCFLFPSLHDSSGNVVLEAQAFGLPVICLDLGGPATLVPRGSPSVIATRGMSEEAVVAGLADALEAMWANESGRLAASAAGIAFARDMSWASRANGALAMLRALPGG